MSLPRNEAVVIVIDIGYSMHKNSDRTNTDFESAVKAAELMTQQKIMFSSKDEVGIVLVGTQQPHNRLNRDVGGYDNVTTLNQIQIPSVHLLKAVQQIRRGKMDTDIVDGMVVALDMLAERAQQKGKVGRRMMVITGGYGKIDTQGLEAICDQFNTLECKLDLIGVNFGGPIDESSSKRKIKNEKILNTIAAKVNGTVIPSNVIVEALGGCRTKCVKPTTTCRCDLQIGPNFSMPIYTFLKTKQSGLPTLKKVSGMVDEDDDEGDDPTFGKVSQDRVYRPVDDPTRQVRIEDSLPAFCYGKQMVPVIEEDRDKLKYVGDKGMTAFAFVKREKVPRYFSISNVEMVVPDMRYGEKAQQAISSLAIAMRDTDTYLLVRFQKTAKAAPRMGYLAPYINDDTSEYINNGVTYKAGFEYLIFTQLPFEEDIREYTFPSLAENPKANVTVDQQNKMDALVDAMDLTNAATQPMKNGKTIPHIAPETAFNPVAQFFYKCIKERALNPGCPLPTRDPEVDSFARPNPYLIEHANDELKEVQLAFPLKKIIKETTKKNLWADVPDAAGIPDASNPALPNMSGDNTTSMNIAPPTVDSNGVKVEANLVDAMFQKDVIKEVGNVNPVDDFFAMLNYTQEDLFEKAYSGMCKRISSFVEDGGAIYYDKAIGCLRALKQGCKTKDFAEKFNAYLTELKTKHSRTGPTNDFWQRMKQETIKPVSVKESTKGMDNDEAKEFYQTIAYIPAPAVTPAMATMADESDDDFDDMSD